MVRLDHSATSPTRRRVAGSESYRLVEATIRGRILEITGHLSIAALAGAIGLNHESVRRALRNGSVSLELATRVCFHFGVSAEWLVFGSGPRAPGTPRSLPTAELMGCLGSTESPSRNPKQTDPSVHQCPSAERSPPRQ